MGITSGVMNAGLASNAPIWSLRYGGTGFAVVRSVVVSVADTATAFAIGTANFQLFVARSFSANDSGGTAATLTGNNGKLRTSYATNNLADLRISSTAALTPGTRTLDATALASRAIGVMATSGMSIVTPTPLFWRDTPDQQPIQLAQNEGLVVEATVPATGTWTCTVEVLWDEIASYS